MTRLERPDFFIVGAPKSGTTAIADYLGQHPQIFMPATKELHYFGRDLDYRRRRPKSEAEYLTWFHGSSAAQRVGEASVGYLYSQSAPLEMLEFAPESDILIMLRNPVDMIYSQHRQLLFSGDEDIDDFEQALAAEPDRAAGKRIPSGCTVPYALRYRWAADYYEHVARYIEVFGEQHVHITLFDELATSPESAYAALLAFLGVDPQFRPEFAVVNPNKSVRSALFQELVRNPPAPLARIGRSLVPPEARVRLRRSFYSLNSRRIERPPLSYALRRRLGHEFAPGIERLARLIARDLSAWLADPESSGASGSGETESRVATPRLDES